MEGAANQDFNGAEAKKDEEDQDNGKVDEEELAAIKKKAGKPQFNLNTEQKNEWEN